MYSPSVQKRSSVLGGLQGEGCTRYPNSQSQIDISLKSEAAKGSEREREREDKFGVQRGRDGIQIKTTLYWAAISLLHEPTGLVAITVDREIKRERIAFLVKFQSGLLSGG